LVWLAATLECASDLLARAQEPGRQSGPVLLDAGERGDRDRDE
jgi:hypothetical protein